MFSSSNRPESIARDVSNALGIAFESSSGAVAFARPLRLTEWSVPLIFDGHLAHRGGTLVPADFVGHVLWAGLRKLADTPDPDDSRSWWTCELSAFAAQAIVDDCLGIDDEASLYDELDIYPEWSGGHASGM